jgi:hypothetical protein
VIQPRSKDTKIETLKITISFDFPRELYTVPPAGYGSHSCYIGQPSRGVEKSRFELIPEAVWQYADSHGGVRMDNEVVCIVRKKIKK